MTTVTVLPAGAPDLPRPPRDLEPRLAPPELLPFSAAAADGAGIAVSAMLRFLPATAAFLQIAARGATLGAGTSFGAFRAWTSLSTAVGPKPGGYWFSRSDDLYISSLGGGMANPTFFSVFGGTGWWLVVSVAASASISFALLIAGGT